MGGCLLGTFKDNGYFDYHQTVFIRESERYAKAGSGCGRLHTSCVVDSGKNALYRSTSIICKIF
jgi:hypothetical protein